MVRVTYSVESSYRGFKLVGYSVIKTNKVTRKHVVVSIHKTREEAEAAVAALRA